MKKMLILTFLLSTALFMACSDDDSSNTFSISLDIPSSSSMDTVMTKECFFLTKALGATPQKTLPLKLRSNTIHLAKV